MSLSDSYLPCLTLVRSYIYIHMYILPFPYLPPWLPASVSYNVALVYCIVLCIALLFRQPWGAWLLLGKGGLMLSGRGLKRPNQAVMVLARAPPASFLDSLVPTEGASFTYPGYRAGAGEETQR